MEKEDSINIFETSLFSLLECLNIEALPEGFWATKRLVQLENFKIISSYDVLRRIKKTKTLLID